MLSNRVLWFEHIDAPINVSEPLIRHGLNRTEHIMKPKTDKCERLHTKFSNQVVPGRIPFGGRFVLPSDGGTTEKEKVSWFSKIWSRIRNSKRFELIV